MPVAGHTPPPFFKRGPAPLVRLAFFVAASLFLLVADLRFQTLEPLRMAIATVLWPAQQALFLPVEGAVDAGKYFSSLAHLTEENARLQARELEVAHLLLRQTHLEDENRRLRALLDMKAQVDAPVLAGEILYATRDPFVRRVIINRGETHGVSAGQAIIDATGVIGQVSRVFPLASEVMLLTDRNQAIPVQVARNGLRAVLAGTGGGMELKFLPVTADVEPGDTLVTSGLDGIYLPGLPVARVEGIDRDSSLTFARIEATPLAGVERHRQVLVLGKRPPLPEIPVEAPPGYVGPASPSTVKPEGSPP